MPFLLLFLLTLICLQSEWPAPPTWLGVYGCLVATWAGILVLCAGAALWTRRCRRMLLQDPSQRHHWMRRFASGRGNHCLAMLIFFIAALYSGWGWIIKGPETGEWLFSGMEPPLLLAPILLGLTGSWAVFYPMERAVHEVALYPENVTFLSRWSYVALQARHNLLLVVPPLVLIVLQQIVHRLIGSDPTEELVPLSVGLLAVAFLAMPLLLRLFLGLSSMPAGTLRERLEGAAQRLHFRFSDILVWNTRNTVANAMVTGIVPWVRYVVVTDKLIDTLTPEEIEGVFGHEVGHIKHHHMLFYIFFVAASLLCLGSLFGLGTAILEHLDVNSWLATEAPLVASFFGGLRFFSALFALSVFAVYMFVFFGYISRRCERQADIYGCQSTSTEAFIEALEKVALLNGIPRDKPGWLWSWQHGTIGQRVRFLETWLRDPSMEPKFQKNLLYLKCGIVAVMVGITSAAAACAMLVSGDTSAVEFLKMLLVM